MIQELVLNLLAEATTKLTKIENPSGLEENKETARRGGTIASNTRKETDKPIIIQKNALAFSKLIEDVVGKREDNSQEE